MPLSVSLWNDLSDAVFDGVVWDWRVSRAEPMLSCWHGLLFLFCHLLFYLFFLPMGWLCGVGVFGLIVFSLSPSLAQWTHNNNNHNNNNTIMIFYIGHTISISMGIISIPTGEMCISACMICIYQWV